MKPMKIPSLSPQTPKFSIPSTQQTGQVNPMSDLHKMAMGIAMQNILKRKKGWKKSN